MKKLYLGVAAFALAMTACTNNEFEEQIAPEANGITTINAEIVQPQVASADGSSRVIIGDYDGSKYPVYWSPQHPTITQQQADHITVFGAKGESADFIYTGTKPSAVGTFKKSSEKGNDTDIIKMSSAICCLLEKSMFTKVKNVTDKFSLMSFRSFGCGAENAVMYAKYNEKENKFSFQQTMGLLEVNLENLADVKDGLFSENKMWINLVTDKPIATANKSTRYCSLTNLDENPTLVIDEAAGSSNVYNYITSFYNKETTGVAFKNKVYFALPVGDYSYFEVILYGKISNSALHAMNNQTQNAVAKVKITPTNGGKFSIEKKLYPISVSLKKVQ